MIPEVHLKRHKLMNTIISLLLLQLALILVQTNTINATFGYTELELRYR